MRYELTKPEDYRQAKEAVPVAYLPWGAHEWHGLHNPLGLDTLKAHGLCLQLCAETGGVVFPPVYCGTQTMKLHRGFDATIEFSPECVHLLVLEHLRQLAHEGFRVAVILMGHYGPKHQETIRSAVADFNAEQDQCIAWAFPDYEGTKDAGIAGDHAAATETSYIMYFHPELVDLRRLPDDPDLNMDVHGIGGTDPRSNASPKLGRDASNAFVAYASVKVRELLSRSQP